jgi:hypothetical protein
VYDTFIMKIITRKAHAVIDYVAAIMLIALPWVLDFAHGGYETIIPVVLGIATILYSLCTAYEFGPIKLISFNAHILLDTLSALLLIVSPLLFNFYKNIVLPDVIFGVLEICVILMTERSNVSEIRNQRA